MSVRHAVAGGMALLVLTSLLFFCGRKADPIEDEVRQLQRSTVSSGAQLTDATHIERTGWTVKATWLLATSAEWTDYRIELERSMPQGYVLRKTENDGSCLLVKALPADRMQLLVEVVGRDSHVRLRATFLAQPW